MRQLIATMHILLLLCCTLTTTASADIAYFTGGDLKVDGIHFTADNNVVRKLTDLTSPWTILAPNIYYLTGNVGIGTMTPSAPLDVNGSANISGTMSVGGTLTTPSIASTATTGTPPLSVSSTTQVTNLNAEMVGGQKLTGLDGRYINPTLPKATTQQIATLRWRDRRDRDRNLKGRDRNLLFLRGDHITGNEPLSI